MSCPQTSITQASTIRCTPTPWSGTGGAAPAPPCPRRRSAPPRQGQCNAVFAPCPAACTLLLSWPGTWPSLFPTDGCRWLMASSCPLTPSGSSTQSLRGMSLVSGLQASSPPDPVSPWSGREDLCPIVPAGEEVKQADVVLLGYPVPFPLSPHTRRRNLEVYEPVTSPQGPAMTWVSGTVGGPTPHRGVRSAVTFHLSPLTPEHVCCGLDGAEGANTGVGPTGAELHQRHGALQGPHTILL